MGEERDEEREPINPSSPQFLEVTCTKSSKRRRFAAGTEAGFAVYLINRQSGTRVPVATHIEAVKDGEEPICFGPTANLVNYGKDWKLQTVMEEGYQEPKSMHMTSTTSSSIQKSTGLPPRKTASIESGSISSVRYVAKVVVALAFMFLLGATLVGILEKLPEFIEFVTESF